MAWARISDDFIDHPKVAELTVDLEGLAALGLWTSALAWVRADRRRKGVVSTGIAIRYSAGVGLRLAARLVKVGLWDEVDGGGYRFHDFDDVYTPADLSEVRAAAGRAGGRASGRSRSTVGGRKQPQGAGEAKQVASTEIRTSAGKGVDSSPSLFDEHDPLTRGSSPSTTRSKTEAKPKQVASKPEAKRAEASHARAGTTTHYPEASYEASTSSPAESATDDETLEQRVNRLTRTYTDKVKLSNFPAIRSIVKKAVASNDYTDEDITAGLASLASERATVTTNTLRHAIEQTPAWPGNHSWQSRNQSGPRRTGELARSTPPLGSAQARQSSEARNADGWLAVGDQIRAAMANGGQP